MKKYIKPQTASYEMLHKESILAESVSINNSVGTGTQKSIRPKPDSWNSQNWTE